MADPLQTTRAILLGSKLSLLQLRLVLQEALSEEDDVYPYLKLKVFEDDKWWASTRMRFGKQS